jgi:hypothetical protein
VGGWRRVGGWVARLKENKTDSVFKLIFTRS